MASCRFLMPSATAEELSLMAYCSLHFGQRPGPEWVRALIQESLFKMPEVRGMPDGDPHGLINTRGKPFR